MHPTSLTNCQQFFDTYASCFPDKAKVIEIGSQDVNGSIRSTCPSKFEYIGVDFQAAKGVDIVISDPYTLPFEDASVDIVLSNSCFEHSEMFWLVFLEILRVLKPSGLFYLNAPSNGSFHRYPVDCWRFYPDSGRALITWAKKNGLNSELLESFTSLQIGHEWNDFVGVFLKDKAHLHCFPNRILNQKKDYYNGLVLGGDHFLNPIESTEDRKKLDVISQIVHNQIKIF